MKLEIELLPRGAWGNNLRELLPQDDWNILRRACYAKTKNRCAICGKTTDILHAHEVWRFDSEKKTQTLTDILALCPACHGVKHFRNSERIGFYEQAKAHFIDVNGCDELEFAAHYATAQEEFERLNQVYRWHVIADLKRFGGHNMVIQDRNIPFIYNPYSKAYFPMCNELNKPSILNIAVDNYRGIITVTANSAQKIQWYADGEIKKTDFMYMGLESNFSVENLTADAVQFCLVGENSEIISQLFALRKA